jgi:methyl-accepting chemotaxis protein
MKPNGFSHIRKWLWIFLLFVVFITVAVFLLIYHQINAFGVATLSEFEAAGDLAAGWTAFKLKLLLLLSGGVIVICIAGLMWVRIAWRRLNKPVRIIDRAVSRLAAGKLNVTVNIESSDEFGKIGAGLNELAANLQELLLFIWKQSGQCISLLQKIGRRPDPHSCEEALTDNPTAFAQLNDSILNLRQMAESYVFYDVRLDGEQAVAIEEPGQARTNIDPAD